MPKLTYQNHVFLILRFHSSNGSSFGLPLNHIFYKLFKKLTALLTALAYVLHFLTHKAIYDAKFNLKTNQNKNNNKQTQPLPTCGFKIHAQWSRDHVGSVIHREQLLQIVVPFRVCIYKPLVDLEVLGYRSYHLPALRLYKEYKVI